MHLEKIRQSILDGVSLRQKILEDKTLLENISKAVDVIVQAFKADHGLLVCGNGGSAADAQHIAAEFVGRFYYDRPPLRAEAICSNTSDLTCIGNDYGFEFVFSRAVTGKGRKGDIFWGISTSGNSKNVLHACEAARQKGMTVIGLTGEGGGKMKSLCDILLAVPSDCTPRIQECHITIGHIICELVETQMFPKK